MSFLHRFTAALSSALLLQLTLLGSGTLRADRVLATNSPHASAARVAVGTGAHGMSSAAHSAAPESMAGDGPAMPQGCDMSGNGTDCHLPSAPGMCGSAASCAAAVPAVIASLALAVPPGAAVLPEPASIRSGPASAPELPPPRA